MDDISIKLLKKEKEGKCKSCNPEFELGMQMQNLLSSFVSVKRPGNGD